MMLIFGENEDTPRHFHLVMMGFFNIKSGSRVRQSTRKIFYTLIRIRIRYKNQVDKLDIRKESVIL